MHRLAIAAAGLVTLGAAALAANDGPSASEIIEIEVPLEKLAECQQTLREVAGMPAVHDNGTPILFDRSADLPDVRCVAENA